MTEGTVLGGMGESRSQHSGKMRRQRGAEPIKIQEWQHGCFPKAFVWRGHQFDVHAVERCWTVSRHVRGGRVEQHCFRVRCPEGTFEVCHDIRRNTWHLERRATQSQ